MALRVGGRVRAPGAALALITCCQLILVVDATIVNVALPSIRWSLGFSPEDLSWVVNAYTLTFGGLLLLGGRAGDILGHRRVFVAGAALFTVASLAGGFAVSPAWLLAARAAQGVGAAFAGPASLALVAVTFEEGPRRARALAVFSMAASAGMVVGLVVGGMLTMWASWRWVLFVNVPVGAAVVVLAPRLVAESERLPGRFDVMGALTSTAGTSLLVYGFIRAARRGWGEGWTVAAFGGAVAVLGVFVAVEARARQPVMPLRLFAGRERRGAYGMRLLLTAAMSGMLFFLTLFVQDVLGYSPLRTGLAFLPTTVALVVASRAVPWLLPRLGARPVMVAGSVLCVAGMVWLTGVGGGLVAILGPVLLFGAGTGLVAVAATFVALSSVPRADSGAASGLLQGMQQVGGSLGVAVLVTVYASGPGSVAGMRRAFAAGVVLTVCMLVIAVAGFAGQGVRGSTNWRRSSEQ
ncbi:MFS transporter [Actinomadura sp. DC4]|uniref:MFS transporter n=1 Tax=Actinomadura sp. DC4 TaxID=3055069 RepID=UPI0025B117E3|nr:MFS transporter [Actinomadura sp. DC4]MDN3356282.1 MFS transporter [Actinomadura sp. DC4]